MLRESILPTSTLADRPLRCDDDTPLREPGDIVVIVLAVGAPIVLVDAVRSLLAQDVVPDILVVNSGGGDARGLLAAHGIEVPVLAFQEVLYAGAARNVGIKATAAPVVAFLASDCRAEPGWIAGRLARHRAGKAAVASAVVNSHPRNPFAWASHLCTYAFRLPQIPAKNAVCYGASYERALFSRYGLFREDLRTGEDTEFHTRLPSREKPVWAPEVRAVHRNPTSPFALIGDQYRRGRRAGKAYAELFDLPVRELVTRRFRSIMRSYRVARDAMTGADRMLVVAVWPLVVTGALAHVAGIAAFRMRRMRSITRALRQWSVSRLAHKAARAEERADWAAALDAWQGVLSRSPRRLRALRGQALALVRLGRHAEAAAAFRTIIDRRPADIAARKGLAAALAADRDWSGALAGWRGVLRVAPGDLEARIGRARATLRLGRLEAAESLFRSLARRHPGRSAVLGGLLDTLWTRNDDAGVIEVAGRLWRRRGTPIAARRLVTALVHLGRVEEADSFIREVEGGGGDRALVVALQIVRHRMTGEWTRLAALLRANRAQAEGGDGSFVAEVDCLLVLGRTDELRRLFEASPPSRAEQMNATVLLGMAQAFGRSRIGQALVPLLRPPCLWGLSSAALACAVVAAEGDDYPLLADALRRIDEEPLRCEDLRLPLMAPFAAAFHESLASLRQMRPWPPSYGEVPGNSLEARVRRVLQATGTEAGGAARVLDFAARFEALRRRGYPLHLHVTCDITDALAVADVIVGALERKVPLSVLRLGDGEGGFLPCPPRFAHHRREDQVQFFNAWWGQAGSAGDFSFLEQALGAAVDDADVVGIPDLERLVGSVRNLSDERLGQPNRRMMRGYVRVLEHVLGNAEARPAGVLTSSHFHQAFITWRLWGPILRRAGACSVITCHAPLPARMEGASGVLVRRTYLLPPEAKWSDAFADTRAGRHYPDRFLEIRDELDVLPGELFLVAAGVLGKIYCQWIKAAGGVAVDIGSVADHWCGYRTRYSVDALQTITPVSADDYVRRAADDPRIARILGMVR